MNLSDRVLMAAEKGLMRVAEKIFMLSQREVPVDKGTLKKSGFVRKISGGVEIVYRTPYAASVEFGFEAHDQEVKRHYVSEHLRRRFRGRKLRPKRYINVHAHFRGPYTRSVLARAGAHFLLNAVDAVRPEIGKLVGRELKREFVTRSK